ncbi:MAG: META domain-containing protein [Nitrospira sp.]|nr:META domain-containing protein [Nitrospira sp.]
MAQTGSVKFKRLEQPGVRSHLKRGDTPIERVPCLSLPNRSAPYSGSTGRSIEREPSIVLHSENHRVAGSSGCNRLTGTYPVEGRTLHFSRTAATKMACADGMRQEQAFLDALRHVETWKVIGEHLELYDHRGTTLLRFEATHLR